MKIETHRIPSQGLTLKYQKQTSEFKILKEMVATGEYHFKAPLAIDLEVLPARDFIEVSGRITTIVALACSRCLERYELPLKHQFQLTFSQKIPKELHSDDTQGAELTADQIGVIYFKGEEIDFRDAIQEQVVMALPYIALCKQTCKGLCPHCGIDLNHDTCQCDGRPASGPFDVLKGLKLSSQ